MIVPLYMGKQVRIEYKNCKRISLLSVVINIYAGILVHKFLIGTGGLIDNEQGGFRAGRGCKDQIFILKKIGEKA